MITPATLVFFPTVTQVGSVNLRESTVIPSRTQLTPISLWASGLFVARIVKGLGRCQGSCQLSCFGFSNETYPGGPGAGEIGAWSRRKGSIKSLARLNVRRWLDRRGFFCMKYAGAFVIHVVSLLRSQPYVELAALPVLALHSKK